MSPAQARITIQLRGGRVLAQQVNGARGYPTQPASDEELNAKFLACACGPMSETAAERALKLLRTIEDIDDIRTLTGALSARAERS